jgi:predicted XRE-type DNA-binding protein
VRLHRTLYLSTDVRELQATTDFISAQAMSVNIAVNHQDKQASYGQLIRDLAIYSHSSQEQKSRLRPRLREEIHTLLTCPQASHAEVIEGILMQRSFGSLRTFISRHHRRRDGTCRSTQTVDYA